MKKEKTEPVSKEPTTKERSNRPSPKTGGEFNAPLLTQHPSRQTSCGRHGQVDTAGKEVRYWLNHHGETRALIKALEKSSMRPDKLI